jgi:hypothetical protein
MNNFDMYSGDTVDIAVTLTDATGQPLDPTNLTLWWGMADIVKKSPDITYVDNIVTVHLLSTDTIGMSGPHKHQLRGVDSTGRVETFLYGVGRITLSVFQPDAEEEPAVKTLRLVSVRLPVLRKGNA